MDISEEPQQTFLRVLRDLDGRWGVQFAPEQFLPWTFAERGGAIRYAEMHAIFGASNIVVDDPDDDEGIIGRPEA